MELENQTIKQEKILSNDRNFLSIDFLQKGALISDAVCKVETDDSVASGFLIAKSLMLTNNHVLPDSSVAQSAVAKFNFNSHTSTTLEMKFDTSVFITNKKLDFTIVGIKLTTNITPISFFAHYGPAIVFVVSSIRSHSKLNSEEKSQCKHHSASSWSTEGNCVSKQQSLGSHRRKNHVFN